VTPAGEGVTEGLWEIRDSESGTVLAACPDETSARRDVAARVREGNGDRRTVLAGLEVRRPATIGDWSTVGIGTALAEWVALGRTPAFADTITTIQPANEEQRSAADRIAATSLRPIDTLRRLKIPRVVLMLVGLNVIVAIAASCDRRVAGNMLSTMAIMVLVQAAIFGLICLALVLFSRPRGALIRSDVRAGTVTVKQGPFFVRVTVRETSRGGRYTVYQAALADDAFSVDSDVGEELARIGPIIDAKVVLLPSSKEILEIRDADAVEWYRHPAFATDA
jgi:hypothetical protein